MHRCNGIDVFHCNDALELGRGHHRRRRGGAYGAIMVDGGHGRGRSEVEREIV